MLFEHHFAIQTQSQGNVLRSFKVTLDIGFYFVSNTKDRISKKTGIYSEKVFIWYWWQYICNIIKLDEITAIYVSYYVLGPLKRAYSVVQFSQHIRYYISDVGWSKQFWISTERKIHNTRVSLTSANVHITPENAYQLLHTQERIQVFSVL